MENIVSISKTNQIKNALISEKLTENKIMEERVITWLNSEKVCFLVKIKIDINEEWLYIGDSEIQEFRNTEESLKLLKSSVPEPYLTAVLEVWETPTETKNLNEVETTDYEQPKKLSD